MPRQGPDAITRLNAALSDRYRLVGELGEGGMAVVYLADDLRHHRRVALKVLKPELAAKVGAERFLTEIKTTANLQHPNILPLFDSGEADGFLFYVMPFVEGETLRERIDREKQLPVDEAVRIGIAVANALHYAHGQGVVHRDIKPGNILLQAGQPMVGDFGIALALGSASGGRLTETGLSVGTPFYMSPEQATGDQYVGPPSDVYSLGTVLYELLVGDPPYMGSTAQAVLGQIIAGASVSPTEKRRAIPAHVDAALRKALETLPADRFRTAADFARALQDPGFRYGEGDPSVANAARDAWRALALGTSALSLIFLGLFLWSLTRPPPPQPVERFGVPFLDNQRPAEVGGQHFDLSPDGTKLVYRPGEPGSRSMLAVRDWDELTATPIRATEGALYPTISPDGSEVAFFQDGDIKALAFAGGPVRTVLEGAYLPHWGSDGYLYADTDSGAVRVAASGGPPEALTRVAAGDAAHQVTAILPGGATALMQVVRTQEDRSLRSYTYALDLRSLEMTPVVEGANPTYLESGHLVVGANCINPTRCSTMMAVRFDPDDLEIIGQPVGIMDGLTAWSFSDAGKLYYSRGGDEWDGGPRFRMIWVTRDGQATPVDPDWSWLRGRDENQGWAISPDGTALALREWTPEGYDIWLKRLDTGARSRLTFGAAHERMPQWGPDGRTVIFLSDRNGDFDVWSRRADGTGEPALIADPSEQIATAAWSPDGEWLLMRSSEGTSATDARDILAFRPGEDPTPVPLLTTDYREINPVVSPDGNWLAYASDETGRYEIYVRPFPDVAGGRWQVSIDGGRNPQWAHAGQELFFQDPDRRMMAARISGTEGFSVEVPEVLFDPQPDWLAMNLQGIVYDVAPDDLRFMVAERDLTADGAVDDLSVPNVVLVNNFIEVIRERLSR